MRRVAVVIGEAEKALSLVEFLRAGDSFRICAQAHRWPPLTTFNAFLGCEVDDVGEGTMRWRAFALTEQEYAYARSRVDEDGVVDTLGVAAGDWPRWFRAAVALPRPGEG